MTHTKIYSGGGRRRAVAWSLLALLLCIHVFAPYSVAQTDEPERWENGVTEAWWFDLFTKEEVGGARSLWEQIKAENQGGKEHEWAGDYFVGSDTHGTYLRWSPRAGFVIADVDKCAARVMGLTYGRVAASPSLVQFFPDFGRRVRHGHAHTDAEGAGAPPEMRFLPVKWRGERLLVGEREIAEFGDYVAGLGEYNEWMAKGLTRDIVSFFSEFEAGADNADSLVRAEDGRQKASAEASRPVVPAPFERFIRPPVNARITAIGAGRRRANPDNESWDDLVIPVTVSAGDADGLKPKMFLRVVGYAGLGGTDETIEVERVGPRSSQGVVVRLLRKRSCVKSHADDCADYDFRKLRVGRRVTTAPFG